MRYFLITWSSHNFYHFALWLDSFQSSTFMVVHFQSAQFNNSYLEMELSSAMQDSKISSLSQNLKSHAEILSGHAERFDWMKERMNQWVTVYYKLLFDNKLPEDGIKMLNQLTGKLLVTFKNGIKKVFAISYNRVVNLDKLFVYINKHLFKYIG